MNDDTFIEQDDNGAPIMLARAPGQVAAQPVGSGAVVFRGARSGNKNFDPITGKFAGKKPLRALQVVAQTVQEGAPVMFTGTPAGVAPDVWNRRMAIVRQAARAMEQMDVAQARTFLNGKVADVNTVDLNAFLADVQWQRMADLADVLDAKIKTKQPVKMVAAGGWVKRIFLNLTPAEGLHLVKALEGKGWDANDINTNVVKKIRNQELRDQLEQLYGEAKPKEGKSGDKENP